MSRGDEIEEGSPRRGWQPPAGGYDDEPDDPRGRGDSVGIGRPSRSGAVTAVGVLAIILGCFVLMGSVCLSVYPIIMPAMLDFVAQQNPNDPNLAKAREAMAKIPTWYLLGFAAVDSLRAIGLLIGGIGVIKRSAPARVLTLGVAGLGVIMFLIGLGANFAFGGIDAADASSVAGGVGGIVCSAIVNLGFAGMAFICLLNARNAAEFRS